MIGNKNKAPGLPAGVSKIAAAIALVLSGATHAQDDQAIDTAEEVEEIVVTGSRIVRRDFNSPSPIATIDREAIEASAHSTMEEVLNKMPQVTPAFGRASNNPGNGTAQINLRGLGPGRGLVMLNSRRLAPSGTGSEVDVNNIPRALVERVEIITGGASTVYGSDALAGVVNFITRKDFEGLTLEASYNVTGKGDAESYDINIAYGTDFAGGAGNVVVYGGYFDRSELFADARALTAQTLSEDSDTGLVEPSGSPATPGGVIVFPEVNLGGGPPDWVTFEPDGTPRQVVFPDDIYNFQPENYLQIPLERYNGGIFATYEMNNGYEWYLESAFVSNTSGNELAPVPVFTFLVTNTDNPLIPTPARPLLENDYLLAPNLSGFFILRRMQETGPRHQDFERDYWRSVLGLRGDLGGGWDFDAWITHTESDELHLLLNDVSRSRLAQSLFVDPFTGQCVDPSGGCVGADIWGENRISPEAAAFLRVPTMTNTSNRVQQLASAFVRGPAFDMWAGTIDVAIGLEWRRDDASFEADAGLFTGDTFGYNGDAPVNGIEEVTEIYAEAIVPLLSDADGGQHLELEVGGRYSSYKNAGSAETFKLGGMWQPIDSLRFRVMRQRSVRAPNNFELFQEQFTVNDEIIRDDSSDDPCSASADPIGNGHRERCIIQGLPESQIGVFEATPFFPMTFLIGGNPDLQPETAETLTFGALITPTALPNWNFAVDYYEIELDGEIGGVDAAFVCFDTANTSYAFCDNIRRGPTGDVIEITELFQNRGIISTKGVDLQVAYRGTVPDAFGMFGGGDFGVNLVWTHVLEELHQENIVARVNKCEGFFDSPCGNREGTAPRNRANVAFSFSKDQLHAQLGAHWIDSTNSYEYVRRARDGRPPPILAIPRIPSKYYANLSLSYDFTDDISASFNVANLFDTDAPPHYGTFTGTNTDVYLYDVFGRTFSLSFSMTVGD